MPLACVVGDVTTGHPPAEPVTALRSSKNSNVSIENSKVIVVGEQLPRHGPPGTGFRHVVYTGTGSADVFISNIPVVRDSDRCVCGDIMTAGVQTTVFVNGRS